MKGTEQLFAYTWMRETPLTRLLQKGRVMGEMVRPVTSDQAVSACPPTLTLALVEGLTVFSQLAAQNLLSEIWSLPGNLIRSVRFTEEVIKGSTSGPHAGWSRH